MKRLLLPLIAALALPTAVNAKTVYLILKSTIDIDGVGLLSVPMNSMDECEQAGLKLLASDRFDTTFAKRDGFECVVGK